MSDCLYSTGGTGEKSVVSHVVEDGDVGRGEFGGTPERVLVVESWRVQKRVLFMRAKWSDVQRRGIHREVAGTIHRRVTYNSDYLDYNNKSFYIALKNENPFPRTHASVLFQHQIRVSPSVPGIRVVVSGVKLWSRDHH